MTTLFTVRRVGATLLMLASVACAGDQAATTTSAVDVADVGATFVNATSISALAGAPFSLDATRLSVLTSARGKVTYTIAISPANSGLTASAGRVFGTPIISGTIALVVTAVDATGRSATRTFTVNIQSASPLAVASVNNAQGATVGQAFSYDATKGGATFSGGTGALTYEVTFAPSANGLTATEGRIAGVPSTASIITATVTARDASGNAVSNAFPIVMFASDLVSPTLTTAFNYSDASAPLPGHFLNNATPGGSAIAADNTPATNVTTNAGATLGRVLFYDRRLSANDKVACASCHQQQFSFGDSARLSLGFNGGRTDRHSMTLANARFYSRGRFFWDERAATLEDQVLQPIQNATEMGMTLPAVLTKTSVSSYYPALFQAAFGTPEITTDRIARALAQFVRSMVSSTAKFDQAFIGAGPPNFNAVFTADELAGQQLYNGQAGCIRCHETSAFNSDNIHNTGLDVTITDVGAGGGRFKAPSLRNMGVKSRFMHDGRFTTLEQVVDFYNAGIQNNPNLDQRLRGPGGQPQRLNLSTTQRAQLIAFLRTLTDNAFLTNPKFGNPFGQ